VIDLDDISDFGGADLGPAPRGHGPELGLVVAARAKPAKDGFDELREEERIYHRQGPFVPTFSEVDDDSGEEVIVPYREDIRRP